MPKTKNKKSVSVHPYKGLLIAVEGVDGSGKSTQLELLQNWLNSNGFATVRTEWTSSELVRPLLKKIKKKEIIVSPETFSLAYVADVAERWEKLIKPALAAGKIVLCDRYLYTALARDAARGLDPEWVREIYSFLPAADLGMYFRVSPSVAAGRKISMPKFYEAGMDLRLHRNIKKSFEIFQKRVIEGYEKMATHDGLEIIDGETDIYTTFPKVKKLAADLIQRKFGIQLF
jgi:dTMP kinase